MRWLVADRFYLYALTSGEAQQRAGRYLRLDRAAWPGLTVEPAGHYTAAGNQIVGGPPTSQPEGRDS